MSIFFHYIFTVTTKSYFQQQPKLSFFLFIITPKLFYSWAKHHWQVPAFFKQLFASFCIQSFLLPLLKREREREKERETLLFWRVSGSQLTSAVHCYSSHLLIYLKLVEDKDRNRPSFEFQVEARKMKKKEESPFPRMENLTIYFRVPTGEICEEMNSMINWILMRKRMEPSLSTLTWPLRNAISETIGHRFKPFWNAITVWENIKRCDRNNLLQSLDDMH